MHRVIDVVFYCYSDVVTKVAEVGGGLVLERVDVGWSEQRLLHDRVDERRIVDDALRLVQRHNVYTAAPPPPRPQPRVISPLLSALVLTAAAATSLSTTTPFQ